MKRVVLWGLALGVGVFAAAQIPEMVRYIKIKTM